MPRPKHKRHIAHPIIGTHGSAGMPRDRYVRGATGATRPERDDTYKIGETEHRWDGKCHADCEDVR